MELVVSALMIRVAPLYATVPYDREYKQIIFSRSHGEVIS